MHACRSCGLRRSNGERPVDDPVEIARDYLIYRLNEGWGLFRILDDLGLVHEPQMRERDAVMLLARYWKSYLAPLADKHDRRRVARTAKRAA